MVERIRENQNIRVLEEHTAIDLIMLSRFGGPDLCSGVYALGPDARTKAETRKKWGHLLQAAPAVVAD